MANEEDDITKAEALPVGSDVGWEWERDLESQGHGECWRVSHLEDALELFDTEPEPRACRRSDIRIYEEVCELLMDHPMVDATKVEVEVVEGVVVLRGQVCTRQEIVLCYEIVEDVAGIAGQEILLRVRPYEPVRWEELGEDSDGTGR